VVLLIGQRVFVPQSQGFFVAGLLLFRFLKIKKQ